MENINEKIKRCLIDAGFLFNEAIRESFFDAIDRIKKDVYDDAINEGIDKTIYALDDANIKEDDIIRIVENKWSIKEDEIIDRLNFIRKKDAIKCLKRYLRVQGYSINEVHKFMLDNKAYKKIKYEKDIWKLRKNPKELMKEVMKNKD